MSIKGTKTCSSFLEWDTMLNLIQRLLKDGDVVYSLLIGTGCFFGLRISDLRHLTWGDILLQDEFRIIEQKTKKERKNKINQYIQKHIQECFEKLGRPSLETPCFLSIRGTILSIQRINMHLKEIKNKYHIHIDRFSSHSFRKTFGRRAFEASGEKADISLVLLCDLFGHSSVSITKRYLGIRESGVLELYNLIEM